jgi:hypothetical protein
VTVHKLNQPNDDQFFSTANASNGDTFDLTARGAGMVLFGLSNTTLRFTANGGSATFISDGPTTIYDEGHGTRLTLASGDGLVTIYDFQNDHTGFIQEMQTASSTGHLTQSSDGHGGLYLTGVGLTVHLVGDHSIPASQHS